MCLRIFRHLNRGNIWIIWVESKCNHKCPDKNEIDGMTEKKSCEGSKGKQHQRRYYINRFEGRGRDHKPKDAPLEAGKEEETHCPLDLPVKHSSK